MESQRTSRRVIEDPGGYVKVFSGKSIGVIGKSVLTDYFVINGDGY